MASNPPYLVATASWHVADAMGQESDSWEIVADWDEELLYPIGVGVMSCCGTIVGWGAGAGDERWGRKPNILGFMSFREIILK